MTLQVQCENAGRWGRKGMEHRAGWWALLSHVIYTHCAVICACGAQFWLWHCKCYTSSAGRNAGEGRIWGSVSAADPKPAAAALESSRPPSSLSSQMGESSSRFERGKMGSNSVHSKLPHHLVCGETGQNRRQPRWKSEESRAKG